MTQPDKSCNLIVRFDFEKCQLGKFYMTPAQKYLEIVQDCKTHRIEDSNYQSMDSRYRLDIIYMMTVPFGFEMIQ